ncbi:hypothetical protein V8Z80_08370 [Orrella sp. JC864]|uniref:hypothetical protein n=1 Tax=Orrella sp. JC864 TaxID=3120298 RepID=UPI00300B9D49
MKTYRYEYEVRNASGALIASGLTFAAAQARAAKPGCGLMYGLRIRKYRTKA